MMPAAPGQQIADAARVVIEAWSPDATAARQNLERQIDRIAGVVAKLELSVAHKRFAGVSHGG